MYSAQFINSLQATRGIATVIQALQKLAENSNIFSEWAADELDDMARSLAIMGADGAPYAYYSLEEEAEAHHSQKLSLGYGCEEYQDDDEYLRSIGLLIVDEFNSSGLDAELDDSSCRIIVAFSPKVSVNDDDTEGVLACLYFSGDARAMNRAFFEDHFPNECDDEDVELQECVSIYLELADHESVQQAVRRLVPESLWSEIRFYQRCFDNGREVIPLELPSVWVQE